MIELLQGHVTSQLLAPQAGYTGASFQRKKKRGILFVIIMMNKSVKGKNNTSKNKDKTMQEKAK